MSTPDIGSNDAQTQARPNSGWWERVVELDRSHYAALAATWPAGAVVLKVLSQEPKGLEELRELLPDDDLRSILSRLKASGLVEPRFGEIKNPEQGRRRRKALSKNLWAGPAVLEMLGRGEMVNPAEILFPANGAAAIFFAQHTLDINDYQFVLSAEGKLLIKKLDAQLRL